MRPPDASSKCAKRPFSFPLIKLDHLRLWVTEKAALYPTAAAGPLHIRNKICLIA